jgi:dipeptide/tripeptide permease
VSLWRPGRVPRTVCAVSEKALVLLLGVVLAAGLAGVAVVSDDPLILALAAAVAFVAVGYGMPARRLSLFIARRQPKPPGVAPIAFLFTFLGISMVWATTTALSTTDSYLRLAGWVFVTLFSALGATIVAAHRCAEDLTGDPVDKPTR